MNLNYIMHKSIEAFTGNIDVGVTAWVHDDDPAKSAFFDHRANLAVAGLIVGNVDPVYAAHLVHSGYVRARPNFPQRFSAPFQDEGRDMILTIIQVADGRFYDIVGDPKNICPVDQAVDFDPSRYRVCGSRCGYLSDDSVTTRVNQLVTMMPQAVTDQFCTPLDI